MQAQQDMDKHDELSYVLQEPLKQQGLFKAGVKALSGAHLQQLLEERAQASLQQS